MAVLAVADIFNPQQRMAMSTVVSLLALFGFIGNITVCITFCRSKHLQSSANIFIVNLAITDTLQCLNMIFMITAVNDVRWFTINGLCQMNAFGQVTFIGTSVLSLALISLNRYFLIVKNSSGNIFTRRNTVLFIFFDWLIPLVLAISPVLGWSKHIFRTGYLSCLLDFSASLSYLIAFFGSFLFLPTAVMCFCSWKILVTLRRTRQRIKEVASISRNINKDERRVSLMLFVVIIAFFIFYMPISIINFIEVFSGGKYKIDPSIEVVTLIMSQVNHVNNPVIYGLLNRNYRRAFLEVFCRRGFQESCKTTSSLGARSPMTSHR